MCFLKKDGKRQLLQQKRIRLTTKFEADFFVIKVFQYFKKK